MPQDLLWAISHLHLCCTDPYPQPVSQRTSGTGPPRVQIWPRWFSTKSAPSFVWLSSAWQGPAQLLAAVYDKRWPHGRQPHPRKHPSSQKSSSFWLSVGFSAACFQSPHCQDDCSTGQGCPRVTAGGCSGPWWSLQFTSLPLQPFPLQKPFQLISTSANFRPISTRCSEVKNLRQATEKHSATPKDTNTARAHVPATKGQIKTCRGRQAHDYWKGKSKFR